MSSWDRQAALKKYQALFAAANSPEALIEELGTPTKLAIDLAAVYVPTPAPSVIAEAMMKCPVALEALLRDPRALAAELTALPEETDSAPRPETWVFRTEPAEDAPAPEPEAPEEEPPAAPRSRGRIRVGALVGYLIPAIVIGLPVAGLLGCVGSPLLVGGAGIGFAAVYALLHVIGQLRLVSDVLMAAGAALIVCAVGLLLCWFGLWLSMELCWLWIGKAVFGLGRLLCVRREAAA